jgi:hypothetical protein
VVSDGCVLHISDVTCVVEKAKRAGASEETSGIMIELDICGKFVGSQLMLQVPSLMLT